MCKAAHYCNAACLAQDQAHDQPCVLCVCTLKERGVCMVHNPTIPLPHDPDCVLMRMGKEVFSLAMEAHSEKNKGNTIRAVLAKLQGDDARASDYHECVCAHDARARDLCERACALRKVEIECWIAANNALGALKVYYAQAGLYAVVLDCIEAIEPVYLSHDLLARMSQAQCVGEQFAIFTQTHKQTNKSSDSCLSTRVREFRLLHPQSLRLLNPSSRVLHPSSRLLHPLFEI